MDNDSNEGHEAYISVIILPSPSSIGPCMHADSSHYDVYSTLHQNVYTVEYAIQCIYLFLEKANIYITTARYGSTADESSLHLPV